MDNRLIAISDMLANYSMGNFDYNVELSSNLDEIDTIISGVNMLGEELQSTTVSRDFFSSIYDAVSNMLFVMSPEGEIRDVNKATGDKLKYDTEHLIGQSISTILSADAPLTFDFIKRTLSKSSKGIHFESDFITNENNIIHSSCACSKIINQTGEFEGYLLIAEDITTKKETEKLLMRTILETQEGERKRVADDLHDSLGQELSTIKMMLGITVLELKSEESKEIVNSCIDILDGSISGVRDICFDLMPSVLEVGGLLQALEQLIGRLPIEVSLECNVDELELSKQKELMLYRVCQEFINNTVKHAKADLVTIKIKKNKKSLSLEIKDDGEGFDIEERERKDGRGMSTMKTRVESFGGKYDLKSKPGKGTTMTIEFKA